MEEEEYAIILHTKFILRLKSEIEKYQKYQSDEIKKYARIIELTEDACRLYKEFLYAIQHPIIKDIENKNEVKIVKLM